MSSILLTNFYSTKLLSIIEKDLPEGFELIYLEEADKRELIKKAGKAHYLLVGGSLEIDQEVIDAAVNLRMIQRSGVGIDKIDLELLKERAIPLYVNKGVNARSVAEHTIMLILSTLRQLPRADMSVRSGRWLKHELGVECRELNGKIVGLVGLGSIGMEVLNMLHAFGVTVLYFKRSRLTKSEEKYLNIKYMALPELLKQVDILSLHCPLSSETTGMISHSELAIMKAGSIIVNTSRGGLIDEDALLASLQSGHLGGVGLDVFSREPISESNPLLRHDKVVVTPHIGGVTLESFSRIMASAFNNIRLFEEGKAELIENKRIQ